MCGRMVCSLAKEKLQKACSTRDIHSQTFKELQWEDGANGGHTYSPSCNICPTDVTPVIVAGKDGVPVLKPMMWGVIPHWHKGQYNSHKLSTNNCRIENVLNSKLYNPALQRGQRCVVVCDGFYEWQTTKSEKQKQPYFIYSPQPEGVKIDDPDSWRDEFSSAEGWAGPRLLYMAALYSPWTNTEGEEFIAYSIITMASNSTFSWLHHRMPAILNSDAQVLAWINQSTYDAKMALSVLLPVNTLEWHPVSTQVNNSRNKTAGLNKAVKEAQENKKSKSADWMKNWLQQKGKREANEEANEQPELKRPKPSS